MKIHSDRLTPRDIEECVPSHCYLANFSSDVGYGSIHQAGSRKAKYAFIVRLSGSNRNRMRNLPDKSATYGEWGKFIAALYERDNDAVIGHYKNVFDFNEKTRYYLYKES